MALSTAVVGGGRVSGRHLDGLSACPHTELTAVCDIDPERAGAVAAEYGIVGYTDMSELLDERDLDWVHICTPVGTHLPLARQAIEAGVPALIQKPVTETVEEYEQLASLAETHDVAVSVVHNHNFDRAMRQLQAALADGAVGEIRSVQVYHTGKTYPDDERRGEWSFELPGGEFEEGVPHPLYLLLRVGGYPREDQEAQIRTQLVGEYDRPFTYDGLTLQYASEQDVLCTATVLPGTVPERSVRVHGEDGLLVADLVSQSLITLDRDYAASALDRARNNLKHAVDRVRGNLDNIRAVVRRNRSEEWEAVTELDSHYYQFTEEALALSGRRERPVPLSEAGWTIRLMEQIRDTAADRDAVTQDVM